MLRQLPFIIVLLAIFVGACAKEQRHVAARPEGVVTARSQAFGDALRRQTEGTATLKALAWIELDDGEEERFTEAALVISRPASIRIDAFDQLADVWAMAASDGTKVWLYVPAKSKLYSGRASKSNLHKLAKFDWEIPELVSVIAGSPPLGSDFHLIQLGPAHDGHFVQEGGGLHIWADRKSLLPLKCARYGKSDGEPDFEVVFSDYKRIGKVVFPHRIDAAFPSRGAKITVVYREVEIGGVVDPGVFVSPKNAKRVDLKD